MLHFAGCKINLGLSVTGKRNDGFHNIETVFYPIPWFDAIELLPATVNTVTNYGINIPGTPEENVCYKAYQLLSRDFNLQPMRWILLKNIPLGAGLGGGSSNAAIALHLLNLYYNLNLTQTDLVKYASQIGSDCAFYIKNTPQFATGRGEILQDVNLTLKGYYIMIVYPAIHINTAWAYSVLAEEKLYSASGKVEEAIKLPIFSWKEYLVNDFEKIIFKKYPLLEDIKQRIYDSGAVYASMSGTGSSIFGIYKTELSKTDIQKLFPAEDYRLFHSKLD